MTKSEQFKKLTDMINGLIYDIDDANSVTKAELTDLYYKLVQARNSLYQYSGYTEIGG